MELSLAIDKSSNMEKNTRKLKNNIFELAINPFLNRFLGNWKPKWVPENPNLEYPATHYISRQLINAISHMSNAKKMQDNRNYKNNNKKEEERSPDILQKFFTINSESDFWVLFTCDRSICNQFQLYQKNLTLLQ